MFTLKFLLVLLCLTQVFSTHVTHVNHELPLEHDAQVPAIPSSFSCSGSSNKCRVQLQFGANVYWASWSVDVNTNPPYN